MEGGNFPCRRSKAEVRISKSSIRNNSKDPSGKREKREAQIVMKLTNDSYTISIGTSNFTERYYRDKAGWLKVSARGRKFRMTAEQVLNHVLPAVAGLKPNVVIKVEHNEG